jgi:RNA polymerase sigma-70 factor (ECF subfamily)
MALTSVDHKALVEAHNTGDDTAFEAIVHTYYEGLFAHALRRLQDPHAAEDAVQETLSRAYRALPRFSGDYQLRAWLHRILTNVCHDEGRRRQRDAQLVERVAAVPVEVTAVDDDLGQLDVPRREVIEALKSLPASYREAMVLRYVEEKTFHEVAEATGVTEGNARLRVHRGRAALRRALGATVALVVWIVPLLRRGQKPAIAAELVGTHSATVAAGAPVAVRVAETSMPFVDKTPSIGNLIGVAATLVVPAAVPVMSNSIAERTSSPPAAVAAPAPPPTTSAPPTAAEVAATAVTTAGSGSPATPTTLSTTPTTVAAAAGPTAVGAVATGTAGAVAGRPGSPSTTVAPTPAAPRRAGKVVSSDLVVTTDHRTNINGSVRLTVGSDNTTGTISGWMQLPPGTYAGASSGTGTSTSADDSSGSEPAASGSDGQAAAAEGSSGTGSNSSGYTAAAAPSGNGPFTAELTVRLPDGTPLRIVLDGTATAQGDGTSKISGTYRLFDRCPGERATGALNGLLRLEEAPVLSSLSLDMASFASDVASLRTGTTCAS